ncbi:PorT family protein [Saprospiraceae bacterium]|nr:PorT family protein [Saprospiraceae bacterium]
MSKKITFLLAFIFTISTVSMLSAQDYKFGIRAGLNSSQFLGTLISDEKQKDAFSMNNGIHFGVTFAYYFSDNFGLRTEVGYNQIGTNYKYEADDAEYVFRNLFEREPRQGKIIRTLDINNSYIHVPIMVFAKPFKKLEVFGGVYTQFLVLPTAGGTIDFTALNPEDQKYSFEQGIEANYYSDEARQGKGSQTLEVDLIIDGEVEDIIMPRLVGGYYELDENEKAGSTYNWFDFGVEGGVSYFFNNSLYLGLTGMFGLSDVTNNALDVDYYRVDENSRYVYRSDFDRNLSIQLSLGFKF